MSSSTQPKLGLNRELHRLLTFKDGPEFAVSVLSLARNGFSMAGDQSQEVLCFHCGIHISDWHAGDIPIDKHRHFSPNCPMVTGRDSDNIPMQPLPIDFLKQIESASDRIVHPGSVRDATDTISTLGQNVSVNSKSFHDTYKSALNRATKRNVSLFGTAAGCIVNRENPDYDALRYESTRHSTFHDFPAQIPVTSHDLALNGFFYTGERDRVQCAFCRIFLSNWTETDVVKTEHEKHAPDCPFVRRLDVGNVPINNDVGVYKQTSGRLPLSAVTSLTNNSRQRTETDHSHVPTSVTLQQTAEILSRNSDNNTSNTGGTFSTTPQYTSSPVHRQQQTFANLQFKPNDLPKHPQYNDIKARRQTFYCQGVKVPQGQNIDRLVEAGFYYVGPDDDVKCFCCDVSLKNFQPSDDPWTEHAKWFPRCTYLCQKKDLTFIQRAQQQRDTWLSENVPLQNPNRTAHEIPGVENVVTPMPGVLTDDFPDAGPNHSSTRRPGHTNNNQAGCGDYVEFTKSVAGNTGQGTTVRHLSLGAGATGAAGATGTDRDADADGADPEADQLLDENRQLRDARTCKVCMDAEVNVVFLPCGHLVCCDKCSPELRNCAVCRSLIRGTVKIFLS